jgi:signal transduction histidine kinase
VSRPDASTTQRAVSNHRPGAAELPAALSVAAHDVAEGLRVVTGYIELLEGHVEGKLDEAAQRYVGGVRNGIDHLDALLTGLLVYLRVNVEPPRPERVELSDSLEEALRPLRAQLEKRNARIEFGDLPAVLADPGRTRDVMRALIDNALTFAPDDAPPAIAVGAEREGDAWRVDVRDNGIGLPPDACERVLQPFERAHPRSRATGPGLGLAIARSITERRGGRLWIEAADGGGTVVHFTIPDEVPA